MKTWNVFNVELKSTFAAKWSNMVEITYLPRFTDVFGESANGRRHRPLTSISWKARLAVKVPRTSEILPLMRMHTMRGSGQLGERKGRNEIGRRGKFPRLPFPS